ncbi:MAG: MFS transporter [Clostridia bacterium]|nr:MFS transporter [Clostridia bacterium]
MKAKKWIFVVIIGLFIAAVVFFNTVLNMSSFRSSYVEAETENNLVVLETILERIEYGLRYGKELDNYYDLESIFADTEKYCHSDAFFICDTECTGLYGVEVPSWASSEIKENPTTYEEDGNTWLLSPIHKGTETAGYVGIRFTVDLDEASELTDRMYRTAIWISAGGILLFVILFLLVKHQMKPKLLLRIIIPVVLAVNLLIVLNVHFAIRDGYQSIANRMAEKLITRSADDINALIGKGVRYSDISDTEETFRRLTELEQIDNAGMAVAEEDGAITTPLVTDSEGVQYYLSVRVSDSYVNGKVMSATLNVVVSSVTAIMIAYELLIFLMGVLVEEKRDRRHRHEQTGEVDLEHVELVRGLSFFFATFRYMSVAFMAVVLAQIYIPVRIFGYEIPYEIVMSLPLSMQVLISMLTSFLSGLLIDRRGWKRITMFGVLIMTVGTLLSSFAKEPIPFILAQMVVGTGLGFAKMGIDVYAVTVSSEHNMSIFTANSNAAIIVGFSCAASVGALLAGVFGYSGAYLVMTVTGVAVFFLIYIYGMDAIQIRKKEQTAQKKQKIGFDPHFFTYILFIVAPYSFIMMFVDYFFPVFAVGKGVSMEIIGVVMLLYGMATAYIGTWICKKQGNKVPPAVLLTICLLVLAVTIGVFAFREYVVLAALIVLTIGVADGIMPSMQFEYLYHLPLSERIGFSRTLGIEGFFSSLIGAAAPVIFSVVMMVGGLYIIAGVVLLCAILFYIINNKKKAKTTTLCLILLAGLALTTTTANAERIGFCQAESYYEFDYQIYEIACAVEEDFAGDPSDETYMARGASARQVWNRLCESGTSFEYVPEAFVDLSTASWARLSEEEQAEKYRALLEEYNIDLVITMGTAGGLFVKDNTDVQYMNFLASDPIDSGIVESAESSGTARGWAHLSEGIDERALSVMHDIFKPTKIGIVYNLDDPESYIYSSASSVDAYAAQNGVEVVRRSVSDDIDDSEEMYEAYRTEMLNAHQELADSGIDLYILTTSLLEPEDFAPVLAPLVEKGIPVFSVNSTEDVRYGATAAVEMCDYTNIGRFAAEALQAWKNGQSLDSISQIYDTAPFLVVNIDTLQKSGIKLPLDVLLSVSEIYGRYGEE